MPPPPSLHLEVRDSLPNAVEHEVSDIKTNMATKREFIFVQQTMLETNEMVKKIEQNMEKHERILDLLSRRSIEHEAAISSIRLIKAT
ncbi:hypothetical protein AF2641_01140 [Anoxybacillus flavithermus]|nr:hypothetical protein AF2641_01140 [Anoxybacillus flavithermus]